MLNFEHMVSMYVACMIAMWGLVFLWQDDNTFAQCESYLWVVYLPISYVVQLMNMKAYRLSVFLTSENKHRLKRLNHHRVMLLTIACTAITAIVLLVITLVVPPIRTRIVVDPVRPSMDYYVCQVNSVASSLLYALVVGHLLFSIICVFAVRNGSEAFRDGMVLKESFMFFWLLILMALIMNMLNLSPGTSYVLRTLFICLAVTIFTLRIMISRCFRHWIPTWMLILIGKCILTAKKILPISPSPSRYSSSIDMSSDDDDEEDCRYEEETVAEDSIDEMLEVLEDPARSRMFKDFAHKSLVGENADFLLALLRFREASE